MLLCRNLKAICLKGGFRLTKWISNSRGVLTAIPEKEMAKELKDLDLDQDLLPIERALRIQWCVESDQFKFRIAIQDKPPTRRNILSLVSSVYDPLGFLAPVVLPAKKTLQELCRLKLSWDDIIPDHFAQRWGEWIEDLQFLTDFGVDRCFKPAHYLLSSAGQQRPRPFCVCHGKSKGGPTEAHHHPMFGIDSGDLGSAHGHIDKEGTGATARKFNVLDRQHGCA